MPESFTQVASVSLGLIGQDPLTDIESDITTRGKLARLIHLDVLDATLRDADWNFATIDGVSLSSHGTDPTHTYSKRFLMPTDPYCLRVLEVYGAGVPIQYKVKGRFIHCDATPIILDYIFRVLDVATFDPLFLAAYQHRLAAMLAVPLTGKRTLFNDMWTLYKLFRDEASEIDSQEGTPKSIVMTGLTTNINNF